MSGGDIKMKLKIIILLLVAFISCNTNTGTELKVIELKINTKSGPKVFQVFDKYILEHKRFYIANNSNNYWIITETRYHDGKGWSEWSVSQEIPVDYDVSNAFLEWEIKSIYTDDAAGKNMADDVVWVNTTDQFNKKYWWESQKYFNLLRKMYYVVPK